MWVDIVLGVVIGGCIIWGFLKGGIREIFGILGIIIGIFGASRLYTRFATVLPISNWAVAKAVSFIIVFVVIALLLYFIGFLIYKLMHLLRVGFLDRILGLVLGAIKGSLLAGVICFFITLFPQGDNIVHNSKIAPIVFKELRILRGLFPRQIQKKLIWRTPRQVALSKLCVILWLLE